MQEILLRGKKYRGKFEGDKREANETSTEEGEIKLHHHECYDGRGKIHKFKSSNIYSFNFLVREDSCKSSLEETLKKLALRGHDSFLKSIISRIRESGKQDPKIYLPR